MMMIFECTRFLEGDRLLVDAVSRYVGSNAQAMGHRWSAGFCFEKLLRQSETNGVGKKRRSEGFVQSVRSIHDRSQNPIAFACWAAKRWDFDKGRYLR